MIIKGVGAPEIHQNKLLNQNFNSHNKYGFLQHSQIIHNNSTMKIYLISNRQHPQPVSEPEPEEEVHVTGVHSLQQGQDEGRHQVRVQEAAP